jgi:hypothetical protein
MESNPSQKGREKEVSDKREAYERMVKRIVTSTKGKTTEREARKLAERIAIRHDHKNGK